MLFGLIKGKNGKNNGNVVGAAAEAAQQAPAAPYRYWETYASWRPKLEGMTASLANISKNIEDEFLSVGGKLQDFSDLCSKISALSGSIGRMIESGSGFNSQAFDNVFKKAYGEIESCCTVISDKVCSLTGLSARIDDILLLRRFLERLSKSITIIGTLARIETTRVSETEFQSMTMAVDDLALQIAKNTAELSSAAVEVNGGIRVINSKMEEGNRKIHEELDVTGARMGEILEQMESMTNQAKWACKRMEGRAAQISPELGEVIVALQSHDICRQQMQHVGEALSDISSRIAAMDSMAESEKAGFGPWVTEAVGIQILQLEHSISETAVAAKGISEHLSTIADLADAQQEDATMILEDEESGSGRILKISSEVETLSTLMADGKVMMTSTIEDIAKVNSRVGSMTEQVGNIELISDNINLLALNAMIKVSRTGEAGRGLGVLADEIRKLSNRANDEITKGSAAINSILSNSKALGESLVFEMNNRLASIEEVFQQTQKAVDELLGADKTMMQSMGEITGITKSLDAEIGEVISGIRFDRIVSEGVGSMVSELRKMMADVEATIPEGVTVDEKELEALKSRYTIHSERRIHESRSTEGVKEEAGNVEFF